MLQHFFASEVDGRPTQGLFDDCAIAKLEKGEFLSAHQGQYPVIFITLKDIKVDSYDAAITKSTLIIQRLYRQHESILDSNALTNSQRTLFHKYLEASDF